MGRTSPKNQQRDALRRRAAKRRQKQQAIRGTTASAEIRVGRPNSWPLHECLATKEWQKPGTIVQILVARRSPSGKIATAVFLVDLACLGVKNAMVRRFNSRQAYEKSLREPILESQELIAVDLNLAAKVVFEAIAYADSLGFSPHPDSHRTLPFLEGADPQACDAAVPLGDGTGKPLFIAGPYDDARRIVAQLQRAVGPGGFQTVVPLGEDNLFFPEEE